MIKQQKYDILLLLSFILLNATILFPNNKETIEKAHPHRKKNCNIIVKLKNTDSNLSTKSYISNESLYYQFDSIALKKGKDKISLRVQDPIPAVLYINNHPENILRFYLCKGRYRLYIDFRTKHAYIKGSKLNAEFQEKMRIQDSLYKKYGIMHAVLYPYTGMNRDSAQVLLQKYLPYCDSISEIHFRKFHETHPASYLTLEHIHQQLSYTFDNPGYDTMMYNRIRLKEQFDQLHPKLRNYNLYQECLNLFGKEYPTLEKPQAPLFPVEEK